MRDVKALKFSLGKINEATRVNLNQTWQRLNIWPDLAVAVEGLRTAFSARPDECGSGTVGNWASTAVDRSATNLADLAKRLACACR